MEGVRIAHWTTARPMNLPLCRTDRHSKSDGEVGDNWNRLRGRRQNTKYMLSSPNTLGNRLHRIPIVGLECVNEEQGTRNNGPEERLTIRLRICLRGALALM